MELHRTEDMLSPTGALVSVTVVGVAAHQGALRDLVLGLKFGRERANARSLADVVLRVLPLLVVPGSVLTWAPTTSHHHHERGMDHAEEIARWVAAGSSLPIRKMLRRLDDRNQTGLGRAERQVGPVFVARPMRARVPCVVIDDVVTTGATFRAAASALVRVGAPSVLCIAPSRTP